MKTVKRTFSATHPGFWGVGGVLVTYGLTRKTCWGRLAATAGGFILAAKVAEAMSCVAVVPPPGSKSVSNLQQEG